MQYVKLVIMYRYFAGTPLLVFCAWPCKTPSSVTGCCQKTNLPVLLLINIEVDYIIGPVI